HWQALSWCRVQFHSGIFSEAGGYCPAV
ncbi:hypothetical protein Q4I30_001905, partial [Leishmania utingensis]